MLNKLNSSASAQQLFRASIGLGINKMDSLQHLNSKDSADNPGTLHIARSNPLEWSRTSISPNSLLENIEIHPQKGLMNLIASAGFVLGQLTQTEKRDLQRAISSVLMAYNELAEQVGEGKITIHENHLKGDGKINDDRHIPRQSNPRDYDFYHTLGVSFADNHKMLPHYHLEFEGIIDQGKARALLASLQEIGDSIFGKRVLSDEDIARVLDKLPEAKEGTATITGEQISKNREKLPSELDSPAAKVSNRDTLESHFIGLCSQNTEYNFLHKKFVSNQHMNSFRPAEYEFACLSDGHTAVIDNLQAIEAYPNLAGNNQALNQKDLYAIFKDLKKLSTELPLYEGASANERAELSTRLSTALNKIKDTLKSGE